MAGGVEPDVEDLDGAGVLDAADRARLVEESIDMLAIDRDLRPQHFDRDLGPDARLLREEHLAHASSAKLRGHAEVTDRLSDHRRPAYQLSNLVMVRSPWT
ncbi:MAG: hypothetical protein H0V17_09665 [Deltaproteobacteria bacterium]|nr:hypothetical protein [Deltaproteobacteria bacterium]